MDGHNDRPKVSQTNRQTSRQINVSTVTSFSFFSFDWSCSWKKVIIKLTLRKQLFCIFCVEKKWNKDLDVCLRLNRTFESVSVIFVWHNLNLTNQPTTIKQTTKPRHQPPTEKNFKWLYGLTTIIKCFHAFLYMFGSCREPQKTSRFPNIIKTPNLFKKYMYSGSFHLPSAMFETLSSTSNDNS